MTLLSNEEIERGLDGREWRREGDAIVCEFTLENFSAAMGFANRVGEAAESADHHPDILVHGWNRVRLRSTTHSAGGLTQRDLDLSRTIDQLV
jgi:4a-hydroxytetrahydrobiopterin dehydratase